VALLGMTGPQHSYPSGFPNAQQGTMRNQFGGAPQIGGLMTSVQQTGSLVYVIHSAYNLSNETRKFYKWRHNLATMEWS
jgi:hypothetical protein